MKVLIITEGGRQALRKLDSEADPGKRVKRRRNREGRAEGSTEKGRGRMNRGGDGNSMKEAVGQGKSQGELKEQL